MKRSVFVLACVVASGTANADVLTIGFQEPGFGPPVFVDGHCNDGNARGVVAPDGRSLTFLYDEFFVELVDGDVKDVRRCFAHSFLTLPAGQRLVAIDIDYRGAVDIDPGVRGRFGGSYQVNGVLWDKDHFVVDGPHDGDFLVTHSLTGPVPGAGWDCNVRTVDFRLRNRVAVRKMKQYKKSKKGYAFLAVDSGDALADIQVGFRTEPCTMP